MLAQRGLLQPEPELPEPQLLALREPLLLELVLQVLREQAQPGLLLWEQQPGQVRAQLLPLRQALARAPLLWVLELGQAVAWELPVQVQVQA